MAVCSLFGSVWQPQGEEMRYVRRVRSTAGPVTDTSCTAAAVTGTRWPGESQRRNDPFGLEDAGDLGIGSAVKATVKEFGASIMPTSCRSGRFSAYPCCERRPCAG